VGERVAHQVDDHLAQPRLVADDHQRRRGAIVAGQQLDAAVGRDRARVVDGVGGHPEQVDGALLERALLVEAGQQQQVLDQQAHPDRLLLDATHQLGGLVGSALPVELGEAPDGGQRGAQLVAGVRDEAAHPLLRAARGRLRGGPCAEGGLDLGEHAVERRAEPPDLGAWVPVGDAPGELARGDGPGGLLDLDQRAQARAHDRHPDPDQDQQDPAAHGQVDGLEPADGAVDVVERPGDDQRSAGAVGDGSIRTRQRPPPLAAWTVKGVPACASR